MLRTDLLTQLRASKEQCIRQFLTLEEMGDCKLSQFLRHHRNIALDDLLYSIWFSRLPHNIRAILAGQSKSIALV
jgi:hypothetical protein